MNKFNIKYWDDTSYDKDVLIGTFESIQRKFDFVNYEFIELDKLLSLDDISVKEIDYLVLDIYDKKLDRKVGLDVLSVLKSKNISIPIIIYSSYTGTSIDSLELKRNYPEIEICNKNENSVPKIIELISAEIINKIDLQFELESDYINELKQQIYYFGESKLNQLIIKIKDHYKISYQEKITLRKLKSGFSGAILFKFKINNSDFILKISNDINLIENELSNAKTLYNLFPQKMFVSIIDNPFYTSTKDAIAIVIKLLDNSDTLYNYILKSKKPEEEIPLMLKSIFIENGLKGSYSQNKRNKVNWFSIFNKFKKGGRSITISEVNNEIRYLLMEYNQDEVNKFLIEGDYDYLNATTLKYEGYETLNHLDLHSKNIMLQNNTTPFLIDTGNLGYDYWCFDVARLIVDLFINGFYVESREFYDINNFKENIEFGKQIVDLKPLEDDKINTNFIYSINWLAEKVNEIYSEYFTTWEFQLGLMKEFLQMSYRTSIPHNKRAIALELSYYCLQRANENAKIHFSKT